jgi:hypothetical protein
VAKSHDCKRELRNIEILNTIFFLVLFLLGDKDKEIHDFSDCEPEKLIKGF